MRKEIRLTGFGGQGIALMGQILGKAASLYSGLEAVMTQAYGPEARGGASSANIVISDKQIAYPFVQKPDILVALSQEAYTKFRDTASIDALILIDDGLVTPRMNDRVKTIPATSLAEGLGRRIVANVVMLGFLTEVLGLIDQEFIIEAIKTTVKPKTIPLNLSAFSAGYEYAHREKLQVSEV
ncbi:MAG: 2-oxoacid:acceptor oxidoreductase family protein [Anaerolineaceae bacterium]|nr:2-oxoacid:acceptor oxidoreductase family protein [Anaerolineaceae bacterium]